MGILCTKKKKNEGKKRKQNKEKEKEKMNTSSLMLERCQWPGTPSLCSVGRKFRLLGTTFIQKSWYPILIIFYSYFLYYIPTLIFLLLCTEIPTPKINTEAQPFTKLPRNPTSVLRGYSTTRRSISRRGMKRDQLQYTALHILYIACLSFPFVNIFVCFCWHLHDVNTFTRCRLLLW